MPACMPLQSSRGSGSRAAYCQRNFHEVAIECSQNGLMSHHTDALPLALYLYDDRLQPLNHIHVALPTRIPACRDPRSGSLATSRRPYRGRLSLHASPPVRANIGSTSITRYRSLCHGRCLLKPKEIACVRPFYRSHSDDLR